MSGQFSKKNISPDSVLLQQKGELRSRGFILWRGIRPPSVPPGTNIRVAVPPPHIY